MHSQTLALIKRFNEVFNEHDVDGVMAMMTEDVVFENTSPAPDGERFQGQAAVRRFWEGFFRDNPTAVIEVEEMFATADRCAQTWTYRWSDTGHVRGVDVFHIREGKISAKLSYVKG